MFPGTWRETSTGELIETEALAIGDGYRAKNAEFGGSGLPFLRISNLTNGSITLAGADMFPEENLDRVGDKVSQPGDCVIATKATIGRLAFIDASTPRLVYSPQVSYWRVLDANVIEPQFLRYWLQGREFLLQVQAMKGATDMADYVNLRDQRRMNLTLPPIEIQRSIGQALSAFDDLIANNTRRIEVLEKMARAIYREWFVEFRYPGHEGVPLIESELGPIPKGWTAQPMGEFATVVDCSHARKPQEEPDGAGLLLHVWNVGGAGRLDLTKQFRIRADDYEAWSKRIEASPGDCVITKTGRVGAVGQIPNGVKAALGRNLVAIRRVDAPTFLIGYLTSQTKDREVQRLTARGTIMESLPVGSVEDMHVPVPPVPVMHRYEGLVRPLRRQVEVLAGTNAVLVTTRDFLLPKLVSGEIDVSNFYLDSVA